MSTSDDVKEHFYEDLTQVIGAVPRNDKLFNLGDFNAHVDVTLLRGKDTVGNHGVRNINSNGTLLITTSAQNDTVITSTVFQQRNKFKTTWMHPGSKHWHLLDYILL
jgi:hypothetical protein